VSRLIRLASSVLIASLGTVKVANAGGLAGSHTSMVRQHQAAIDLDYGFVKSASDVERLVASGELTRVAPNANVTLSGVSYPYARPVTWSFIERLAKQYRDATGTPLVVTSLTRPTSAQPRNASPLSVHPAGMAVDLRIPADSAALAWLEKKLLSLEEAGAIDVTREYHPPHLHIAVFPEQFGALAAREDSAAAREAAARAAVLRVTAQSSTDATPIHRGVWVRFAAAGLIALALLTGTVVMRLRALAAPPVSPG